MISGRPQHAEVAETVRALIAGRPFDIVWRNDLGGLTFEVVNADGEREFIKWAPAGSGIDLLREALRLDWASSFIRVPQVIDTGDAADGAWMRTAGLPGDSAVSPRWINDPSTAVTAIGQALRQLHERLPVDECPFSWSISERVADAYERAEHGQLDVTDWEAEHPGASLPAALQTAASAPSIDRLVVCHGDACAPNTLIAEDGRWVAHVDLGDLGVADRWADLAVATLSTRWNYGPGWEEHLLAAYGVEPDPERTEYYRLLWALDP